MSLHRAAALVVHALAALILLIVIAGVALAHDWYPIECCHSLDCAPVTASSWVAGALVTADGTSTPALPHLVVTTRIGTAVVPDNLPRRVSHDSQMHACIRNDGSAGMHVTCIFEPPGM